MKKISKKEYSCLCENYVFSRTDTGKIYLGELVLGIENIPNRGVIYINGDCADNRKTNLEIVEIE